MTEGQFSAADLEPSQEDRRAARRQLADRVAATVAVLAAGLWVGGMVALGACAAPAVFHNAGPFAADAMGTAFASFDRVALGSAVLVLGAEVVRTWAAGRRSRLPGARVRRISAFLMAGCAAYVGLVLTPRINELHRGGAHRGEGELGAELDQRHKTAETVGKLEAGLGALVIALHVLTLAAGRPEDDEEMTAPGIPGQHV